MVDKSYLKRRGHVWCVRVPVPADLRSALGKSEYVRSLQTSDVREANRLKHSHLAAWKDHFENVRQGGEERTPPTPRLSKKDIYREARSDYRDRALPVSGDGLSLVDIETDGIVEQAVKRAGVSDPEELDSLPDDLQARLDALHDYQEEARGAEPHDTPEYGMSVSEAARGYLARLSRDKKTQQTAAQYGSTLRLFAEFLGDPAVRQLRRKHVLDFIEEVERFDPNWGRSPKTKERSWEELVRKYQMPDGEVSLSNKTINRYLTAINGMWEWVHRGDDVPPAPITHRL